MFEQLDFEKFATLAKSHARIAVYKEIAGDRLTPVNAVLALQDRVTAITLLESNPQDRVQGRYSHLCFNPLVSIQSCGQHVSIICNEQTTEIIADPFTVLRDYQTKLACKVEHPLSGYIGGMVGFISYDAIRLIEEIPDNNENVDNIPDILFRFYRNNITFDHQTEKVIITTVVEINDDLDNCYQQAMQEIENISRQILTYKKDYHNNVLTDQTDNSTIKIETNDQDYCDMVKHAKQKIYEGEVFQVVPSRQFSAKISAKPFDVYRALRFCNPSPYMFYIETDDYVIAGASPEKLISIKNGTMESCPLAGTRARGDQADEILAAELLNDEKETAEHMMLVDLARNDLGKVATPGSVKVTKLKEVEQYTRVMHISSTVQAELAKDKDVFDAIQASFPAGTLTGAPKIRAMQLIDELETTRRGIYGGAICGIDNQGNLDSCIAIRTALIKDGVASVRAGAGVVYDSIPQNEADETQHKAKAVIESILLAKEVAA